MTNAVFEEDLEKLKHMYAKVIGSNHIYVKKGFIKCPECGEEILITPPLKKMNQTIENHIQFHKKKLESKLLLKCAKPIYIRLALVRQMLYNL